MAGEKVKDESKDSAASAKTAPWVRLALASFIVVTYVAMPQPLQPLHGEHPSVQHVFYYGWITAVFTGLGAIPLIFFPNLASYWVGLSNGMSREICCQPFADFCSCVC